MSAAAPSVRVRPAHPALTAFCAALAAELERALRDAAAAAPVQERGVEPDADVAVGVLGGDLGAAATSDRPALSLALDGHRVFVGPLGTSPCSECLRLRWQSHRFPAEAGALLGTGCGAPSRRSAPLAALTWLAGLVAGLLKPGGRAAERDEVGQVFVADLLRGTWSAHGLLVHPSCLRCKAAEGAPGPIEMEAAPDLGGRRRQGARLRDALSIVEPFRDALFGSVCGAAGRPTLGARHALLTVATGVVPGTQAWPIDASWHGCSDVPGHAIAVGALEGLERLAGLGVGGSATQAALDDLGPAALDPRLLGLYSDACYQRYPRLCRFTPQLRLGWVPGVSLLGGHSLLVPESAVFYGRAGPMVVASTSSGCASGSSPQEAALYGLLEMIERDALLVAWHARRPLRPIDEATLPDAGLRMKCARARRCGFDVHLLDARHDIDVPVAVAILMRRDREPGAMTLGASAGVTPVSALHGALNEALAARAGFEQRVAGRRQELLAMAREPSRVEQILDHGELYGLPEMADQARFLFQELPPAPFDRVYERWLADRSPEARGGLELGDLLAHCLRSAQAAGAADVVAVDITVREQRALGLCCVRVLVPGLLPIDFGHLRSRAIGSARLQAALRNGAAPNLLPHPIA